jgi:hypothetical protein
MILYFLCFAQLPYRNADNLNEENEDLDQLREEISTWSGLEDERKRRPDLPEKLYKFLRRLYRSIRQAGPVPRTFYMVSKLGLDWMRQVDSAMEDQEVF